MYLNSPSIDEPHEASVIRVSEVAGQREARKQFPVEDLPAAAVGQPRYDIVQLWIGQDVEQGGGEGRLVAGAGLAGVTLPNRVGAGRVQTSTGSVEGFVDVFLGSIIRDGRAVDVLGMDEAKLQ